MSQFKHLIVLSFLVLCFSFAGCERYDEIDSPFINSYIKTATISVDEALSNLDFFLSSNDNIDSKASYSYDISSVACIGRKDMVSCKSQDNSIPDSLYYLVNFNGGNGFAILSATNLIDTPVIAITESGSLNPQVIIDALSHDSSLKNVADCSGFICSSDADKFIASLIVSSSLRNLGKISAESIVGVKSGVPTPEQYGPHVLTKWDQVNPFNSLCTPHPCGCCTIATGQIVVANKVSNSMVFDGYTCNWTDLESVFHYTTPSYPGNSYAQTQASHFAKMLRSSDYLNISGSSGSSIGVKRAFKAFGYSNVKRYWGIGGTNARTAIRTCLQNGLPVYVDGMDSDLTQVGHCWVLDGYKTIVVNAGNNRYVVHPFYHVNWGWNGCYDGYYALGCFDVSERFSIDPVIDNLTSSFTDSSLESANYTWDIWAVTYSL